MIKFDLKNCRATFTDTVKRCSKEVSPLGSLRLGLIDPDY